jgi:hypothetical protein
MDIKIRQPIMGRYLLKTREQALYFAEIHSFTMQPQADYFLVTSGKKLAHFHLHLPGCQLSNFIFS